jgi:hypothetical protein
MSAIEHKPDTMLLMANIHASNETVSVRSNMGTLPEVLESMERFLRGCGYQFEGELDIIPPEKL